MNTRERERGSNYLELLGLSFGSLSFIFQYHFNCLGTINVLMLVKMFACLTVDIVNA